jgi:hypothetical protein
MLHSTLFQIYSKDMQTCMCVCSIDRGSLTACGFSELLALLYVVTLSFKYLKTILAPWGRVFEKLIVLQLVKFPTIYGAARGRRLSLCWVKLITLFLPILFLSYPF